MANIVSVKEFESVTFVTYDDGTFCATGKIAGDVPLHSAHQEKPVFFMQDDIDASFRPTDEIDPRLRDIEDEILRETAYHGNYGYFLDIDEGERENGRRDVIWE